MIDDLVKIIFYELSYFQLYGITFIYFLFLYFVLSLWFLKICKFLYRKEKLKIIIKKVVSKKQIQFEKKHSLKSIFIFGFSVIPIVYSVRVGNYELLPDNFQNFIKGLFALSVWNEIHFFIVHRIMHFPFFMKRVHKIHHKSKVPTVYSVYSFHCLEAFLLSTVPLTMFAIIPLSATAIFVYPFISVLINYTGHCNYRFGNGKGKKWFLFATNHNEHHFFLRKNYAFTFTKLDAYYVIVHNFFKNK